MKTRNDNAGCGTVLLNLAVVLFVVWLALHIGTGA